MNIKIERVYESEKPTIGFLTLEDEIGIKIPNFNLATVELPWRDNQNQISCFPEGKYGAEIYDSPSKGRCILLQNVPGRSYIEIHIANYISELRGCAAIGLTHKDLNGDGLIDVYKSAEAMRLLLEKVSNALTLTVTACKK